MNIDRVFFLSLVEAVSIDCSSSSGGAGVVSLHNVGGFRWQEEQYAGRVSDGASAGAVADGTGRHRDAAVLIRASAPRGASSGAGPLWGWLARRQARHRLRRIRSCSAWAWRGWQDARRRPRSSSHSAHCRRFRAIRALPNLRAGGSARSSTEQSAPAWSLRAYQWAAARRPTMGVRPI